MKYPKINTLWKRNVDSHLIEPGKYSHDAFKNIKKWTVTEKVDGTNIRIYFNAEGVRFAGRTDNADIPEHLLLKLKELFTVENMIQALGALPEEEIILYGEGYGLKIQGGGKYRADVSFILFDVKIGLWWLERPNVVDIAKKLDIDVVPQLEISTVTECIEFIQSVGKTASCLNPMCDMEGVVATADPLVLFRDGTPVKFKLKVKDYKEMVNE